MALVLWDKWTWTKISSPVKHVGTQKKHLDETVLWSTQSMFKLIDKKKIFNFTLKICVYRNPNCSFQLCLLVYYQLTIGEPSLQMEQ